MRDCRIASIFLLGTCAAAADAATLHGRVKDEQCSVLGKIVVRVHALDALQNKAELTTDEGGNYSLELSPGAYEVCISTSSAKHTCTHIDMPSGGDKWMTTQVRDAAPDLSNLGNHANQGVILK